MHVYKKAFNMIVTFALMKQQELAVPCCAISVKENKLKDTTAKLTINIRADARFVEFVDDL